MAILLFRLLALLCLGLCSRRKFILGFTLVMRGVLTDHREKMPKVVIFFDRRFSGGQGEA